MVALEDAQELRLKRLRPQADAVNAGCGQDVGLDGVDGSGIGLDGPFTPGSQNKPPADDCGQAVQCAGLEPGRRSPSDEDRVDLLGFAELAFDLAFQGGQITIGQVVDSGERGEVAITALVRLRKGTCT